MLKVEKVRMGESLRLNIGTAATLGVVTSVRETIAELDLRKPVVAETGRSCRDKQEDSGALASHRVGADKVRAGPREGSSSTAASSSPVMEHPTLLAEPTSWDDIVGRLRAGGRSGPVYQELERLADRRAVARSAALAIDLAEWRVLRSMVRRRGKLQTVRGVPSGRCEEEADRRRARSPTPWMRGRWWPPSTLV